jgi:maltooligosyltrehalose trehalohydrolase
MFDAIDNQLGATWLGAGEAQFCVWAPKVRRVDLEVLSGRRRTVRLQHGDGYHTVTVGRVTPGTRYWYSLDGKNRRADPASRYQPEGVHGPSEIVDSRYRRRDLAWKGMPLSDYIIYELHVGCFTPAGDFDGVIHRLPTLQDLGVTAIELMPLAQFPGVRNWGYDGVFPFAVQNSYGGPSGLTRLVDACHRRGLAVVLDVVYNHLGPEGNHFSDFGGYFNDQYRTPWGPAINFDGPDSDQVRRFFMENALYWIRDLRIDALRLDAIQMIFDNAAVPFLRELARAVHAVGERSGRHVHLIGETNQNDVRQIMPATEGGLGLDAVWNDDFHRSVHSLLTGERMGYYQDYGRLAHVAKACREGFVLDGCYSRWRRQRHGSSSRALPGHRLVVFVQNHDQAGNRLYGERLGHLVCFEQQKLAAALLLLSPYVPLLFMGEEYGEQAPFLYFVDHSDRRLLARVRRGRRRDYPDFVRADPIPDPGSVDTFRRSRLDFRLRTRGRHQVLWRFYQRLIAIRRSGPRSERTAARRPAVDYDEAMHLMRWRTRTGGREIRAVFHFGAHTRRLPFRLAPGTWTRWLDSADGEWLGPGTKVPARIESRGSVHLELAAHSVLVLAAVGDT